MLRKSIKPFVRKEISVPSLCESELKEVLVDVSDPLTGDVITKRKEFVPVTHELSAEDCCSKESADLYSIENMSKIGIVPVTCPVGGFIKQDLSSLGNLENAAIELLDVSEPIVVESSKPVVESSNND